LEEVARAADAAAGEQRRIAQRARAMARQRARGWPWARVLDEEPEPGLLRLMRTSAGRLTEAASRFGLALARALTAEGESRRQVARRLGVTHQRVSAILRNGGRTDGRAGGSG
jgi:hypothetical protein